MNSSSGSIMDSINSDIIIHPQQCLCVQIEFSPKNQGTLQAIWNIIYTNEQIEIGEVIDPDYVSQPNVLLFQNSSHSMTLVIPFFSRNDPLKSWSNWKTATERQRQRDRKKMKPQRVRRDEESDRETDGDSAQQ